MRWKNNYRYIDIFMLFIKLVPGATVLYTLLYIIQFIIPALKIIVIAYFIDTAEQIVSADGADLKSIFIPILFLVLFALNDHLIDVVKSLLRCHTENKINLAVSPAVIERMAKIKYRYYENQNDADVIYRVTNKFSSNISELFLRVFDSLKSVFDIVGFIIILGMQLWWSSIVLIVLCIPIYTIGYKAGTKRYDTDKRLTKLDRRMWYKYVLLTSRETVDERYVFGFTNKLSEDFTKDYEYTRIERKKIERKQSISMKLTSIIVAASAIIIIGILIKPTIKGDISIGMFTSLAGAIFTLRNTLSTEVPEHILNFKYKLEYVKDLNLLLSFETNEGFVEPPTEKHTTIEKIEFKNITFKYPGTDIYILKNISFCLYAGKNYAIVGANGAGKTTITKLLTGLYDEYDGDIFINGRQLSDYTPSEMTSLTAVVYQDFSQYPLDMYDNIAIGNVRHMEEKCKIENAISILELDNVVKKLNNGYKTPITKVKDNGVDLSGGEWQRIALARLFVNSAPLKILDEPTAALDPVAESNIYNKFWEITDKKNNKDNITMFISHRLGSTKLADEILVVDDGAIAEQGTFTELMEKGNIFAEMFSKQAEWYAEDVKSS